VDTPAYLTNRAVHTTILFYKAKSISHYCVRIWLNVLADDIIICVL